MEIIDLFSVPILEKTFDFDLEDMQYDCYCKREIDGGRNISNINGWQSSRLNVGNTPLDYFFDEMLICAKEFADKISLKSDLIMETAWININGPGAYNQVHDHPSCILSGVFYAKAPEDCGNIEFRHPSLSKMERDWSHAEEENNKYTSHVWRFIPKENTAYIFPGWLDHQVFANNSSEDRISISFNVSSP
jgi:uncharacterized protein (TIGR02466 family)